MAETEGSNPAPDILPGPAVNFIEMFKPELTLDVDKHYGSD
jgi:hypothetical protein